MSAGLNLYRRWLALFPAPALEYGQVISTTGGVVSVELHQGGMLAIPSAETWAAGSWVWIRRDQGAWSLMPAPEFQTETIEV